MKIRDSYITNDVFYHADSLHVNMLRRRVKSPGAFSDLMAASWLDRPRLPRRGLVPGASPGRESLEL